MQITPGIPYKRGIPTFIIIDQDGKIYNKFVGFTPGSLIERKNSIEKILSYAYDKRGNLSQVTENGKIKNTYLYGVLNRVEQATDAKGLIARYSYVY